MEKVKDFCTRHNLRRMALGKWDVITVRKSIGKEKLQKRHMVMNIREMYAVFRGAPENRRQRLRMLADLRLQNVLLNSQTHANVCLCTYHHHIGGGCYAVYTVHGYLPNISAYKDFSASCIAASENEDCRFGSCNHDTRGFNEVYPLPDSPNLNEMPAKWKNWKEVDGRLVKLVQLSE